MGDTTVERILIANVAKNLGLILKHELEDEGYAVDVVTRGTARVSDIDWNAAYDIVLLDMQIFGLSGYQQLRRIRNNVSRANIVVFADGSATEERKRLLDSGADACFAKDELGKLKRYLRHE
jgi:DNA-binding response OmpR family regulator